MSPDGRQRRRLLVGVVVHTDVEALLGTLDALADAVGDADRVVLVPDGPDPAMGAALRTEPRLTRLAQWGVAAPRGGPAAFNRIAAGLPAGFGAMVFLESGARPAPDAFDRLAAALDRPGVGLAGPSTNDAWNEQCALPDGTGQAAGLRDGARRLRARYGDGVRSLAPLHSIADVCIAVSVEALTAVGAADEGFGQGPCWEMEYAARAARAGLAAVWVGAAYVHRRPPTRRRRDEEQRNFAAARRRYQDRLCGLRLTGARPGYAPHCIGEACAHFAPATRITLHLPLPARGSPTPPPASLSTPAPTPAVVRIAVRPPPRPLVSCVMPTADRSAWVAKAIEYFHRQDYPARQLLIVDDGAEDLARELPALLDHPAIVHLRLSERRSIGAKRNLGCQRAAGDVLVQWDDDDWYGPTRLSAQLAPLLAGDAEISGLRDAVWFDVDRWRFRQPTPQQHRRLFVEDVHGGTLAFRRTVWERGVRYPDLSLAEDAWFVRQAVLRGARLAALPAAGIYLYVRHGTNSWRLAQGDDGADGWDHVGEPAELLADRGFYAARSSSAPVLPGDGRRATPLATCIMPTADRRRFISAAIDGFLAQRHPSVELLVVDDGADPVADLLPAVPRLRYVFLSGRRPLGEKRNLAVEAARGEVILHFDDDDWSHPDRVRTQFDALRAGTAEVCGLARMLWWDPVRAMAWRYTCPQVRRPWVAGNTLAYLKSSWRQAPFPAKAVGEDTAFVFGHTARRVLPIDDERLVIGTLHTTNTSTRQPHGKAWTPVDVGDVRRVIDEARTGDPWPR
jgi:O-antigen biosynthesis protein